VLKLPSSLWRLLRQHNRQEGQGLVEYAFILVLIALVCLLIVLVLGRQTTNLFSNISSGLPH
jgi:Flp pilus assembly pilin Flp